MSKSAERDFPLFLAQLGSDMQEELHSVLRTLSHNRNFSFLQLQHNLAISQQISQIEERNPAFRRKDRRRDIGDQDGTRIGDATGDIRCGDLNFSGIWSLGACGAKAVLKECVLFDDCHVDNFFQC